MNVADRLREEFVPIADRLAAEYEDRVRRSFTRLTEATPEARRAAISGRHDKSVPRLEAVTAEAQWAACKRFVSFEGGWLGGEISLNEDWLVKKAREYGDDCAEAFIAKLTRKLDGVDDLALTWSSHSGIRFGIAARSGEDAITLAQDSVLKTSTLGLPFHQFPARMRMNGKAITEAALRDVLDARAPAEPDEEDAGPSGP